MARLTAVLGTFVLSLLIFPLGGLFAQNSPIYVNCTPLPPFQPTLFTGCVTTTASQPPTLTTVPRATVTLTPFPTQQAYITQVDPRRTAETLTPQFHLEPFTPTLEETQQVQVEVYRLQQGMNLRDQPSINGRIVGSLPQGYQVTVAEGERTVGAIAWREMWGYWDGRSLNNKGEPDWRELRAWIAERTTTGAVYLEEVR